MWSSTHGCFLAFYALELGDIPSCYGTSFEGRQPLRQRHRLLRTRLRSGVMAENHVSQRQKHYLKAADMMSSHTCVYVAMTRKGERKARAPSHTQARENVCLCDSVLPHLVALQNCVRQAYGPEAQCEDT